MSGPGGRADREQSGAQCGEAVSPVGLAVAEQTDGTLTPTATAPTTPYSTGDSVVHALLSPSALHDLPSW